MWWWLGVFIIFLVGFAINIIVQALDPLSDKELIIFGLTMIIIFLYIFSLVTGSLIVSSEYEIVVDKTYQLRPIENNYYIIPKDDYDYNQRLFIYSYENELDEIAYDTIEDSNLIIKPIGEKEQPYMEICHADYGSDFENSLVSWISKGEQIIFYISESHMKPYKDYNYYCYVGGN